MKLAYLAVAHLVVLGCTTSGRPDPEDARREAMHAESSDPPVESSQVAARTPHETGASQADGCNHDATAFRCIQFLRNYDGDTITVEIPDVHPLLGHEIAIRLRGIDTPEMKGKTACEKAKAAEARNVVTAALAAAKRIDLSDLGRDKYFRIDAVVVADGVVINDLLIERGLAYRYDGGTKAQVDWCKAH